MLEDDLDNVVSVRTTMTSMAGVSLMSVITTESTSADGVFLLVKMSVTWGGDKVKSGKKSDEGW